MSNPAPEVEHNMAHGPSQLGNGSRSREQNDKFEVSSTDEEETHAEEEDGSSSSDSESDEDVDESVLEDMRKLEESFAGISQQYRLINRIGEGSA